MAPYHYQRGIAPPRRSIFAIFAALCVFVLALLAIAQPTASSRRSRVNVERVKSPVRPVGQTRATPTGDQYLIGVGKADITGPVVEINLGGYASLPQTGTGLRQRLYSRAFIIGDVNNPTDRFVYLVLDTQSGDTAMRYGILEGVAALGSDYSMYGSSNIAVTGTHSHSGPGAWFNYLLPQITSLGFDKQSYQAIVDGAVLSIQRAHKSLTTVWPSLNNWPLR
jgi:neutral ceramidase